MAIYPLVKNNNPLLSISLDKVSEDADLEKIKNDLIETMNNFNGIG